MPAKKRRKSKKKNNIRADIKIDIPEKELKCKPKSDCKSKSSMCCGGGLYCVGFIGALVYYISTAQSFWWGVWGVIKALLWPAFLVYEVMKLLGM